MWVKVQQKVVSMPALRWKNWITEEREGEGTQNYLIKAFQGADLQQQVTHS